MKHPEKVGNLLAYSSLIVQNSRAYEGKPWLGYDSHFRRQRAAKRGGMLADVDSSIWTLYFGKAISKEVCEDCLEPGHKSCFKDTGGEPSQKGKGSETRPAGARFQPYTRPARRMGGRQEVCWLFNSGKECRFEKMPGRSCSFLHACAMCRSPDHPVSKCPRKNGGHSGERPFRGGVTNLEGMVSRIESREVESSSMYLTNTCNSSVESIYPIHNSVVGGSVISSSMGSNPFQVDPTHTRIQLRSQGPANSGKYSYTNQLIALDRCKPLNR